MNASTILKPAAILVSILGMQIVSGHAFALNTDSTEMAQLKLDAAIAPLQEVHQFIPPPDTGGPDRTEGTGTR
jgi:hypothetical protein